MKKPKTEPPAGRPALADAYPLLASEFYSTIWAIEPARLEAYHQLLKDRAAGQPLDEDALGISYGSIEKLALERGLDIRADGTVLLTDGQLLVPLVGAIMHRFGNRLRTSGITNPQVFAGIINAAAEDPDVKQIVLDIDTTGGTVDGTQLAADAVWEARQRKRVTSVINETALSAGIWIASQATEVVINPTGQAGSISVIAQHINRSAELEQRGVRVTTLRTGEMKARTGATEELTDDVIADEMRKMMAIHEQFVADVARGRGIPIDQVPDDGRVFVGATAIEAGLADRVGSFQTVIDGTTAPSGRRAAERNTSMDLETLKSEHPETYAAAVAAGRAEAQSEGDAPPPPPATPKPTSSLGADDRSRLDAMERELVRLSSENSSLTEQLRHERRDNIAMQALDTAKLPPAGTFKSGDQEIDLDARFRDSLKEKARAADSDDAARSLVTAAIEERRALLKHQKPTEPTRGNRARVPAGNTEAIANRGTGAEPTKDRPVRNHVSAALAELGL